MIHDNDFVNQAVGDDWNVAMVAGRPEIVIDLAALARLVLVSPLGLAAATEAMKARLPADIFAQLETELAKLTNPFRKEQS